MVVSLGPGKFYGSSLPRPWIYTDVKLNDERVDPPVPVLDPLISWANEAHWSMGGLSNKRLRLQGRIEGNVDKLRKQREKILKKRKQSVSPINRSGKDSSACGGQTIPGDNKFSDSPPPAPNARKTRRFTLLVDEDEDFNGLREKEGAEKAEDEAENGGRVRLLRKLARKLGDDFDQVANDIAVSESKSPAKDIKKGRNSKIAFSRSRNWRSEGESDRRVKSVIKGQKSKAKHKMENESKKMKTNGKKGSLSANVTRTSPRLLKLKRGSG
ncbi:hypothetical protein Nepgr_000419 [Nepenthes gracilis]|uniref:Uncharacterized protein n=1 Tax=Nepenthes gracilis TaxID=150966 RepID=A0AAD3RWQ1_NEPGR|nr:hypothetical protein Nepgr_000419 [Nepenthes gracilis]